MPNAAPVAYVTNGKGSSSSPFKPTAYTYSTAVDALAVTVSKLGSATEMPENSSQNDTFKAITSIASAANPFKIVGAFMGGESTDQKPHASDVISQKLREYSDSGGYVMEGHDGELKGEVVAEGVVCPCCGEMALSASDVFAADSRDFRKDMICKVRARLMT
jgi:hypothetical protein